VKVVGRIETERNELGVNDVYGEARINFLRVLARSGRSAMSDEEQERAILVQSGEKNIDLHYCGHPRNNPLKLPHLSHWTLAGGAVVLNSSMNECNDDENKTKLVRPGIQFQRSAWVVHCEGSSYKTTASLLESKFNLWNEGLRKLYSNPSLSFLDPHITKIKMAVGNKESSENLQLRGRSNQSEP
jgi:hypothetical protein